MYKLLHIPTGLYVGQARQIKENKYVYRLSECPKLFDTCGINVYYNDVSFIWLDGINKPWLRLLPQASKNEFLVMEE